MSGPRFDPTINLGHILTIISFSLAALAAYYGLKAEVDSVSARVTGIERGYDKVVYSLDKLSSVIVDAARIDERLKALERR